MIQEEIEFKKLTPTRLALRHSLEYILYLETNITSKTSCVTASLVFVCFFPHILQCIVSLVLLKVFAKHKCLLNVFDASVILSCSEDFLFTTVG